MITSGQAEFIDFLLLKEGFEPEAPLKYKKVLRPNNTTHMNEIYKLEIIVCDNGGITFGFYYTSPSLSYNYNDIPCKANVTIRYHKLYEGPAGSCDMMKSLYALSFNDILNNDFSYTDILYLIRDSETMSPFEKILYSRDTLESILKRYIEERRLSILRTTADNVIRFPQNIK